MCTLIVLRNVVPGQALVVASNRDEFLSRPSAPPSLMCARETRFVAPQDLEAGGTWMGLNEAGVFVGLTNRRDPTPPGPARPSDGVRAESDSPGTPRSRGLLVRDLLGLPSAASAASAAREVGSSYAPFHLVCADLQSAYLMTHASGRGVALERLAPGAHVICNRDADDPSSRKVETLRERLARVSLDQPLRSVVGALGVLLAEHADPQAGAPGGSEGACVHLDGYGTRSSTILAISESRWHWWHAEGAPCQAKYQNQSRLLDEIRQAPPRSQGKVQ